MSILIENTYDSRPEMDNNPVAKVVEFDGQAISIGPGQRLSVLEDGTAVGFISSNGDVAEITGDTGNTEGYSRS